MKSEGVAIPHRAIRKFDRYGLLINGDLVAGADDPNDERGDKELVGDHDIAGRHIGSHENRIDFTDDTIHYSIPPRSMAEQIGVLPCTTC